MKKTLLAAQLMGLSLAFIHPAIAAARESRTVGGKLRKPRQQRTYKPNGERECARRRRQIAAGILTESNGLVRD